jgi:eukaryotic-like serine/threonine-protein kinase
MLLPEPINWKAMQVVSERYTLLGRLAFGGMAEVWLARQVGPQGFQRLVVVKRVLESKSRDPECLALFAQEARLGAEIHHHNVVQTIDFGEDQGVPFIVLEYVFGETLAHTAKQMKTHNVQMSEAVAARIVADAALGLSAIHQRQTLDGEPLDIVHGDVAPQNIVITYDGTVKVIDFGIAKSTQQAQTTGSNLVRGRIGYISPEQLANLPVDQRSDVFSLGVLLWETVAQVPIYKSKKTEEIVRDLLSSSAPLPLIHSIRPDVSAALSRIISKALEKRPSMRYASSKDFHGVLESFLRESAHTASAASLQTLMNALFQERRGERTRVLRRLTTEMATPVFSQSVLRAVRATDTAVPIEPEASATEIDVELTDGTAEQPVPSVTPGRSSTFRKAVALALLVAVGVLAYTLRMRFDEKSAAFAEATVVVPAGISTPIDVPSSPPAVAQDTVANQAHRSEQTEPQATAPKADQPAPTKKKLPAARAKTGKLRFDTTPWTQVFLKGKKLGDTPLLDIDVPAGPLELLLVNEESNIRTVVSIEVAPGQTTTKKMKF